MPIAREAEVHDPRVDPLHDLVVVAPLFHRGGAEVLDDDVCLLQQAFEEGTAALLAHVQGQARLACVEVVEEAARLHRVFGRDLEPDGWGVSKRMTSSRSGHSIFTTSAPHAASKRVACGPATTQVKSSTTSRQRRGKLRFVASTRDANHPHRFPASPREPAGNDLPNDLV